MRKKVLTLLIFNLAVFSYAGGFRISLQGIKQVAMGNTGVAQIEDASALFFNPAGLAEIKSKWSVSFSGFAVLPKVEYQNRSSGLSYQTKDEVGTPFAIYVSHKLSDKLAAGLGVYTPYGSRVNWGENWSGRHIVRDASLQAFFFQPTLSYKINDWVSFGAGLIYSVGAVTLNRAQYNIGNANIKSDGADGIGYNLGLLLKPNKKVNIGINYRSEVLMKAEGNLSVTNNQGIGLANRSDRWKASLPLVAELTVGTSYKPMDKLTLEFDLNYAFWSSYKSLRFDFQKNGTQAFTRNYKNTFVYRLGASYAFNDHWTARLGGYYDNSPSPDNYFSPETPTTDNRAITSGLGYKFKNGFSIDAYYSFLSGKERTFTNLETNFSGNLKTSTHIFGMGFSYNF